MAASRSRTSAPAPQSGHSHTGEVSENTGYMVIQVRYLKIGIIVIKVRFLKI